MARRSMRRSQSQDAAAVVVAALADTVVEEGAVEVMEAVEAVTEAEEAVADMAVVAMVVDDLEDMAAAVVDMVAADAVMAAVEDTMAVTKIVVVKASLQAGEGRGSWRRLITETVVGRCMSRAQ